MPLTKLALDGQIFGNLRVIEQQGIDDTGKTLWLCKCTCGNTRVVVGTFLTTGVVASCGCMPTKEGLVTAPEAHFDTQPELFSASDLPSTVEGWEKLIADLHKMTRLQYNHVAWALSRTSLYFILREVLSTSQWRDSNGKPFMAHPYVLEFANDVQSWHHNVLDVAARGHIKSTLKTFAFPIQQLLIDPETTIAIFSHTRALAKKFLNQIKTELEHNTLLQVLSYDWGTGARIFWEAPDKEAPYWSLNEGIVVNRRGNPREASVEAWGLVESMPTGRHYKLRLYDDVVTKDSITTSDMIQKTTDSWHLSQALGMPGGTATYTGTFYKFGDTYSHMLNQGVELRVRPCYEISRLEKDDILGSVTRLEVDTDSPVLFSKQYLDELEKTMSPGTWATQYICDPSAAADRGFSQEWILYYSGYPHEEAKGKNIYFLVDAANSKKKDSSYTVMLVIGLGADKNFYLLDGVRDRLNLEERTKTLFRLHRAWEPLDVRYERYGIMADIPHIQHVQQQEGYRFRITEVSGTTSKDDRIERLIPLFSAGRFFLPRELRRTRVDGTRYDLVKEFIDHEFTKWPSCDTKDMLDAMARIQEPNMSLVWPKPKKDEDEYYQYSTSQYAPSWMVA